MDTFDRYDELLFRVHAAIEDDGFFTMFVMGTRTWPSWAYTIGLLERGHPELVTVGLGAESAHSMLTRGADELAAGVVLEPGRSPRRTWEATDGTTFPVAFVAVPDLQWQPPSAMVAMLHAYYDGRGGFPCEPSVRQIVWGDGHGCLPWDPGFDDRLRVFQPVLDEVRWDPPEDEHDTCRPGCEHWNADDDPGRWDAA